MIGESKEFLYTKADFEQICQRVYQWAGIRLSSSKDSMVYSRLARRIRALGLQTFESYLAYLDKHQEEEKQHFINSLTTNLTSFFREPHHFEQLAGYLRANSGPLTIWCAASSTGEEPYSIAMVVREVLGSRGDRIKIIASDIDSQVLATAQKGVYPVDRVMGLSEQRRRQFFLKGKGAQDGYARVVPELSSLIEFKRINLLEPNWPLPELIEIIFCRNVMIYFDKSTQQTILERMIDYMPPNGLYFAGHSENFSHLNKLVRLVGKTTYKAIKEGAWHGRL